MNKYQEVMEHLSVSQLSRQRIQKNVREAVRRRRRERLRRLMPLAAAAVLMVVLLPLGLRLTRPMGSAAPETTAGAVAGQADAAAPKSAVQEENRTMEAAEAEMDAAGMDEEEQAAGIAPGVEVKDLAELAQRTGLELWELTDLPFAAEDVRYTALGGDLAEIVYTGAGQSLCWRVSRGEEENSGDYNEYFAVEELSVAGQSVTLKGEGERRALALWCDGAQSYSIAADPALSREAMLALVESAQR